METRNRILELMVKSDAIDDPDEIRSDMVLRKQGIDSLDIFNLFLLIEETFGVTIPDDDMDKLDTLDAIVAYVESHS